MALIKCPECGKEISDKSTSCINCGYPINSKIISPQKQVICKVHGMTCDLSDIQKMLDENNYDINSICAILIRQTRNNKEIPSLSLSNLSKFIVESKTIPSNWGKDVYTIRCPKCGSTAITTGARGWKWTTGFLGSGKTVNRCGSCGHVWDPKK